MAILFFDNEVIFIIVEETDVIKTKEDQYIATRPAKDYPVGKVLINDNDMIIIRGERD